MVEGVRFLPWLATFERLEKKEPNSLLQKYGEMYDCEKCVRIHDREARRRKSCGWVPRSEWLERDAHWLMGTPSPGRFDTCPGYTTQLPIVHEVATSWWWREKGQLQMRYQDGMSEDLVALIDIFSSSQSAAEQYEIEKAGEG